MTTSIPRLSCPNGGSFFACGDGSRFVGCCRTNPCSLGCATGNLAPTSFDPTQFAAFPDQECSSGSFYTCVYPQQNNATFLGCCKSNACAQGRCAQADLSAAFLSQNSALAQPFLQLNTSYSSRPSSSSASSVLSSVASISSSLSGSSTGSATASVSPSTSAISSSASSSTPDASGSADGKSSSTNVGAIAGGAVGGAVVLLLLVAAIFCCRRRSRTSARPTPLEKYWPFTPKSEFSPSVQQSLFSPSKRGFDSGLASPDVQVSPYFSQESTFAHQYKDTRAELDNQNQAAPSYTAWKPSATPEKPRPQELPVSSTLVELESNASPSAARGRPTYERGDTSTAHELGA